MAEPVPLFNTPPANGFCETPTAKEIMAAASCCLFRRTSGVVIGNPGIGKTTILLEFVRRNSRVHYMEAHRADKSLSAVLRRLCHALGALAHNTIWGTEVSLKRRLDNWYDQLLIIDEAQFLPDDAFDELCSLSDELRIPILFCGNDELIRRLDPARPRAARVSSRLTVRPDPFLRPSEGDVDMIVVAMGVTDQAARRFLFKHSATIHGLRRVVEMARMAIDFAGSAAAVRVTHLKNALAILGGKE